MISIINGKRYDTDKAECVFEHHNGLHSMDLRCRTKDLYRTSKGAWFIHHAGGPSTDLAINTPLGLTGGEKIEPISDEDAFGFLKAHIEEAEATEALEKYFSDWFEDA